MKKIKIGLLGADGRMGCEIIKILESSKEMELFFPITRKTKADSKKSQLVDLWIDFSSPQALSQGLALALEYKRPYLCGTTGLTDKQKKQLQDAAKKIPVLLSSNTSLGVAVLNEALKVFASLNDFDFQIEEVHHIHKKDRPSGTALSLQQNLEKAVGKKIPPPVSIRGGGVFGVHKIFAISDNEMITFEHTALNRAVFARGALRAASWLAKQKAGFYSVKDCL